MIDGTQEAQPAREILRRLRKAVLVAEQVGEGLGRGDVLQREVSEDPSSRTAELPGKHPNDLTSLRPTPDFRGLEMPSDYAVEMMPRPLLRKQRG